MHIDAYGLTIWDFLRFKRIGIATCQEHYQYPTCLKFTLLIFDSCIYLRSLNLIINEIAVCHKPDMLAPYQYLVLNSDLSDDPNWSDVYQSLGGRYQASVPKCGQRAFSFPRKAARSTHIVTHLTSYFIARLHL